MKVSPLESWILNKTRIVSPCREALQNYQLNALLQTLRYAKHKSRFYQERLKDVDIEAIDSFDAFEKLPFTLPSDIQKRAFDFLCVSQTKIERIVTINTSGTTGTEKRLFFTEYDLEATADFFHYGMLSLVDESDTVMVMLPGNSLGSIGHLLKIALGRANIKCVVSGMLNDVEKAAACIQEEGVTCIVGIPMHVFYLSKLKPELFGTYVKKALLSTDYVPKALVTSLKNKGCRVYNHYGMSEMGYGGGVECDCLNGYHLRESDLYFEIIDPKTGKTVQDGEYGEVVFTTFGREAMPLIRYKTGDIARFSTQPCACGTFLRTMDTVLGRIDNKITLNHREIALRELDEIVLSFEEILDFSVISSEGNTLHVRITLPSLEIFNSLEKRLQEKFYDCFNRAFDVRFVPQIQTFLPALTSSMIKRTINDTRNKEPYHD